MKTKRMLFAMLALAGLALILTGVFVFPQDVQKRAAGACYGIGAAGLGLGLAWLFATFFPVWNTEEIKRRKAIEVADERNVLIRDKSAAMVEKWTTWGLVMWMMAEGVVLNNVVGILPPFVLLLLRFGLWIYFTNKYAKTL